jgi:hypothetical protein
MFYTVAAVAEATGLSKSTILGAIESGQITVTRDLSGEWAIEHADLERLYLTIGDSSIDRAPQSPAPDAANIEVESEDLPQDNGDSLRQPSDEGHREPHDGSYQAQRWSAASAPTPEVTWALPSALIADVKLLLPPRQKPGNSHFGLEPQSEPAVQARVIAGRRDHKTGPRPFRLPSQPIGEF